MVIKSKYEISTQMLNVLMRVTRYFINESKKYALSRHQWHSVKLFIPLDYDMLTIDQQTDAGYKYEYHTITS